MAQYFCTTHKDEDLNALAGEKLDMCTNHMVFDSGYDIDSMKSIIEFHPWKVLWIMAKDETAKFGFKFDRLYGIPK